MRPLPLGLQVVTPTPPSWIVEYRQWFAELNERKRVEKPAAFIDTERDREVSSENQQWKPADRITDDDRTGNIRSLWRCLEQRLYFVIRAEGMPSAARLTD